MASYPSSHSTKIPGVVIVKANRRADYVIVHQGSGQPVAMQRLTVGRPGSRSTPVPVAAHKLLRHAREHANRLDRLSLDWTANIDDLVGQLRTLDDPQSDVAGCLLGRPLADVRAEAEAEYAEQQRRQSGEADVDTVTELARQGGHQLTWRRNGQRSRKAACDHCGVEARVTYQSMGDYFRRVLPASPCPTVDS